MTAVIFAVYVVPPVLAIFWAYWTKSQFVRTALPTAALTSLLLFAIILLTELDCERDITLFVNCGILSDWLAHMLSLLQIIYMLTYLLGGPILLFFAAIMEMVSRTRL